MRTALVTGAAGFIGYFVCRTLLEEGWRVIGLDCLSDGDAPLILCVGQAEMQRPVTGHSFTQRRIDLLALEQQAWVLASRDPRCVVVATRTELDWAMKQGQISVWAPSKIVLDATEKPNLSAIDGAALALWFAEEFSAADVLSMNMDGAATPLNNRV